MRIRVPCTKVQQKENDAPEFVVDGILYWDIVEVISVELEDENAFKNIHITPYKEWWCPCPGKDPVIYYQPWRASGCNREGQQGGWVTGMDGPREWGVGG